MGVRTDVAKGEVMFAETRRFSSPSGALIAYHHQRAEGNARGILLVCHGLIEHSKRYRGFARAMAERGFHVFAHDHRGHGETLAADAPIGRFSERSGAVKTVRDVKAMRDMTVEEYPGLPVLLFGHSMGGLVALNTAISHPEAFQAVAVWNSNFNPGLTGRLAQAVLSIERMLKGSDVPSAILPRATFEAWGRSIPGHRTPFDWLSRDPEEVDRYAADPLCRFPASVSMWSDVLALAFRGSRSALLDYLPRSLPIHLVGGGKDPATRGGRDVLWLSHHLKRLAFGNVTTVIYDDMRHETLNEIDREKAIGDFSGWCEKVFPAA